MAIRIVRKQKDKFGNIWLRDNYGGWTNEFGVRFTKTEHRRFGYRISSANRKIAEYQRKYPSTRVSKATDVGARFRKNDLARFRRKSAYKNYLAVTERIITGEQLYSRMPKQYQQNFVKALQKPEFQRLANSSGFGGKVKKVLTQIKQLTPEELIELSKNARTPDINAYYVIIGDIQKSNIDRLDELTTEILSKRK